MKPMLSCDFPWCMVNLSFGMVRESIKHNLIRETISINLKLVDVWTRYWFFLSPHSVVLKILTVGTGQIADRQIVCGHRHGFWVLVALIKLGYNCSHTWWCWQQEDCGSSYTYCTLYYTGTCFSNIKYMRYNLLYLGTLKKHIGFASLSLNRLTHPCQKEKYIFLHWWLNKAGKWLVLNIDQISTEQ